MALQKLASKASRIIRRLGAKVGQTAEYQRGKKAVEKAGRKLLDKAGQEGKKLLDSAVEKGNATIEKHANNLKGRIETAEL